VGRNLVTIAQPRGGVQTHRVLPPILAEGACEVASTAFGWVKAVCRAFGGGSGLAQVTFIIRSKYDGGLGPDTAAETDVDRFFRDKDLEELTRKTYDAMGLEVRDALAPSDLREVGVENELG